MIAIITDRAIIAKEIAISLNIDVKTENDGYFQGRGYMLVWTSEKLIPLSPPEDYGKKRLAGNDLPFIPKKFLLTVRKQEASKKLTDKTALRQLSIIKRVFDECKSIIVATDAGETGELNFRRIYHYLGCNKPFKHLRINSLTIKAIKAGLKNLKGGSLYDNLYMAADCRAKADYLIETNAGCAFSVSTGMVNQQLGRIQIPTLALVCKRFSEHRKFTSTRFFEHGVTLEKDGRFQQFKFSETIEDKKIAEKFYERLKTCREAQITKVESQMSIQPAPLLYNLIELQKDANMRYGFSSLKTMETARKLYEEKLISYPITDSRHITEDVFAGISQIIRQTAFYCKFDNNLNVMEWDNLNDRSVDNSQAGGHHALIPTGVYQQYLPKDERLIYNLIVGRTLEAFAPDCQKETVHIEAVCGDFTFESKTSRIISPGWRLVLNRKKDREDGEVDDNHILPVFVEGETARISGCNLLTRKTMPEHLYTEASLLSAMEDARLGTVETRAGIIEALFSSDYIERRGQNLVPTEKGTVIYNCVKNMRIADVGMAGSYEKMLSDVSRGEQNAGTFMRVFEIFTKQVTKEIIGIKKPAPGKKQ
jgi:DNA topoisomerase-3